MPRFLGAIIAITAIAGVVAQPPEVAHFYTCNHYHGNYGSRSSFGPGRTCYEFDNQSNYTTSITACGIGYQPRLDRQVTSRVIKYSEEPHAFGDYLLGIYGWFTSPLMEYFVVEDYDTYMPWSTADPLGAPITNDGSTYNLYTTWSHEDRPSIHGRVRFVQVWAVRTNRRKSGLVDMRIFFNAWRSRSVPLGVQNYQVVGLEGTFTGGYTCIKAEECGWMYSQCGGENYTGPTCCSEGVCRNNMCQPPV